MSRQAVNAKFASETATTPYPTMQAVTTPQTSLRRGDWGFKRPLPLKSTTNTTTPLVRVKHFDTIEHITDYSSSSDLTLTLDKFHELNAPLTLPQTEKDTTKELPTRSVFEDEIDTLPASGKDAGSRNSRWKFEGPWLAGISNGEFNIYTEKVQERRVEFREFIRSTIAAEMTAAATANAQEKGDPLPAPLTAADITDTQLTDYLRKLRGQNDRAILTDTVGKFLDLAPIAAPQPRAAEELSRKLPKGSILRGVEEREEKKSGTGFGERVDKTAANKLQSPYVREGPPATHPSAGLSYLRTNAFLENHPLYGPQAKHKPVLGRLIKPASGGQNPQIGVGGIITVPVRGESKWDPNAKTKGDDNLAVFDPEIKGGKKQYVQLQSASIASSGKVVMHIWEAEKELVTVAKEMVGEGKVLGQPLDRSSGLNNSYEERKRQREARNMQQRTGRSVTGSSRSYGVRL